ncbi:MAG: hypothetical protein ACOCXA_02905 [Planctomycetota bacterium]
MSQVPGSSRFLETDTLLVIEDWGLSLQFEQGRCSQIMARSAWLSDELGTSDIICHGLRLNADKDRDPRPCLRNLAIDCDSNGSRSLGLGWCNEESGDPPSHWLLRPARPLVLDVHPGHGIGAVRLDTPWRDLAACHFGDDTFNATRETVHWPRYGLRARCHDGRCQRLELDLPPAAMGLRLLPSRRLLTAAELPQVLDCLPARIGMHVQGDRLVVEPACGRRA